jgi:replicative DNA helicase
MQQKLDTFSIEAEKDILGALMRNNRLIDEVIDILHYKHFYSDKNHNALDAKKAFIDVEKNPNNYSIHQKIYLKILEFDSHNKKFDSFSINNYLKNDQSFIDAGGYIYLQNLETRVYEIHSIRARAEHVIELYQRRQILTMAQEMMEKMSSDVPQDYPSQYIEQIEERFSEIKSDNSSGVNSTTISSLLPHIIENTKRAMKGDVKTGLPTGFHDLDNVTGGLQDSDLIILAARPSMGKTALAVNVAYNIAKHHIEDKQGGVLFFSLEMSSDQIAKRLLSMMSGISAFSISTGKFPKNSEKAMNKITEKEIRMLEEVSSELEKLPFYIDETPSISIHNMKSRVRYIMKERKISLILVDYLQLMTSSVNANGQNRVLEISEITKGLKAIAKEFKIPVIALSQLSRAVESRDDKRPQLADLRESGSIEQDADIVMFIYRDEYYLERSQPPEPVNTNDLNAKDTKAWKEWIDKMDGKPAIDENGNFLYNENGELIIRGGARNKADIIIAKHRNGPTGVSTLYFDKEHTRFSNLSKY